MNRVEEVVDYFKALNIPNADAIRLRMSIIDEYPHVRKRYETFGWSPIYGGNFSPSMEQIKLVGDRLSKLGLTFYTCAEDKLANLYPNNFVMKGCISKDDLDILGIIYDTTLFENPQKRSGCHCLSCKTELLTPRTKCAHNCAYCFWKD